MSKILTDKSKATTTDRQHDNPVSSRPFRVNPVIRRKTDRSLEYAQQERARILSCCKLGVVVVMVTDGNHSRMTTNVQDPSTERRFFATVSQTNPVYSSARHGWLGTPADLTPRGRHGGSRGRCPGRGKCARVLRKSRPE